MSTVVAIDLGGTRLRAGLAESSTPTVVKTIGDWPAPESLDDFTAVISALLAEHAATRLGLAVPGLARDNTAVWIPNLPYLDGQNLSQRFPQVEIGLGHDAQLALLAEVTAGAAKGMTDAILLAIGTGIGSAVLAGGSIVRGSSGAAASFGWASADVTDPGEDRLGWLERHASGRALDAAGRSIGLLSGQALITAAASGDPTARSALDRPMTALGTALAGAVALLDPQVVIIAGGVASSTPVLAPLILAALRRHLPPHLRGIELRAGYFERSAGLIGAAVAGARGRNWGTLHG